jgi:ParB family chromosome partitioning protein
VRAIKGANDQYEIVAGERRWRAAQRAGLHEVPIITVEVSDAEALELAIIENVQRADLNPLEEAMGYQSLIDQYKHSQADVAKFVGKSRPHIANTLRLMQLPDSVKALINSGQLTAGHARALVGQPNADELARDIVSRGLNVRQVEALTQQSDGKGPARVGKGKPKGKDADTMALERRVSDALGLNVTIEHRGKGGTVHVSYADLEQMEEVLRRLERD